VTGHHRRPRLVGFAFLIALAGSAPVLADDPLVRSLGGAEVDWGKGLLRARAGAAADPRLPGPDATRADAQRRARERALKILRAALDDLPLGGSRRLNKAAIDGALERVRVLSADYQSNGGVVLELGVAFADLEPGKRPPKPPESGTEDSQLTLSVSSMPLEAMPTVLLGKEEVSRAAVYRLGEPPKSAGSLRARRDKAGRLVLPAGKSEQETRAAKGLIIYLRSVARR
jgi:hypothetical protein